MGEMGTRWMRAGLGGVLLAGCLSAPAVWWVLQPGEARGNPQPAAVRPVPAAEPAPTATGPLVVLDPGHGGGNVGAPAAIEGVFEKDLTLPLARMVQSELESRDIAVALTRDRDAYLTLRQRSDIANELGADVFVSLHANATESHNRRGFETFFLTGDALEIDSRAIRSGGSKRDGVPEHLEPLLDDVERGAAHAHSAELATAIQDRLATVRSKEFDRGVRQGSQHVLLGANMPAALVEIGFIDHPVEGPELLDEEVQRRIAAAIADGIAAHLAER